MGKRGLKTKRARTDWKRTGIAVGFVCSILLCAAISACSREEAVSTSTQTEAETAAVMVSETQTQIQMQEQTQIQTQTPEEEESEEEQSFEESFYEYTARLQEIPQMNYRNSGAIDWYSNNYICHKDTLILKSKIYKKEGSRYVRQASTLNTIFNIDENWGMETAQYRNWAITTSKDDASFLIYDMDTQKKYCYYSVKEGTKIGPFWHIYDGCIYYTEETLEDGFYCRRLKKLSLKNGNITDFYQPAGKGGDNYVLMDFRTRDDGTFMYELLSKTDDGREYWIAQADENRKWSGKKIGEVGRWEFAHLLDFNQYGLVISGYPNPATDREIIVIRDSGETELLEKSISSLGGAQSITDGEYLFTDNGYFCSDLAELDKPVWDTDDIDSEFLSRRLADGVFFYDYAGNLSGYYPLVDKVLLEQGYYLTELTYYEGMLTGFYVQRDTGELYISQVKAMDSGAWRESNSQKWANGQSQNIISQYAAATGYDFETATMEFEQKIQGVWQVKEYVGWDKSLKAQWDGYQGDLFLFCENAWVDDAVAWFQPVYACHTAPMSEIAQNEYFNIQWVDDRYDNRDGILTAAVCTERNKKYGSRREGENFLFILLDDVIVMERNGSYWELEKVGEITMSDAFENVPIE